ncbi:hypothetical protein LTR84_012688 [Exophiala bonariae]|uniref:Uncharacterized protein n=1 Tax=Exophiala bonariae TaxID=1690606 RepID=A0AAV9NFR3_9EURO|nr:hypothetical protein LTR84_012688 [Exophiala bonariae]
MYGPIVRVGPNELSYVTEEAWNDIYKTRKGEEQLKKAFPQTPSFQHGLMDNPYDDQQAVCRKILASTINDQAVRRNENILHSNISALLKHLQRKVRDNGGKAVLDIAHCYECVAFDIIGDLFSGETFGCLKDLELPPLHGELVLGLKRLAIGCAFQTSALTRFLFLRREAPPLPAVTETERRLKQSKKSSEKRNDNILSHVFEDVNRPNGIDRKLATRLAADSIIGGFDTIAIAMVGTTYFLVQNPSKLATVTAEIRSKLKSKSDITLANVNSLRYLNAVFTEGLRLWPPGPETLRRITNAQGNIINGDLIPPKTLVGVYHWTAGRYSRAWKDAEAFVPERWLEEGMNGKYANDQRGVINSFQAGPRNCPGQALANAEFRLVLVTLLWHFDIAAAEHQLPDWSKTKIFGLVANKQPLMVKITPRSEI